MGNKAMIIQIAQARAKCEYGVEYKPRQGAICPVCQAVRMSIFSSRRWKDGIKVRYHKCNNPDCVACAIGLSIKSIELE